MNVKEANLKNFMQWRKNIVFDVQRILKLQLCKIALSAAAQTVRPPVIYTQQAFRYTEYMRECIQHLMTETIKQRASVFTVYRIT